MKKLGNELTLILLMTDGNDYTAQDLCNQLNCTRRNLYYYLQFLRDYGFEVIKKGDYYRLSLQSPFFERLAIALNFTGKEAATMYELAESSGAKKTLLQSIQKKLTRATNASNSNIWKTFPWPFKPIKWCACIAIRRPIATHIKIERWNLLHC